MRTIPWFLCVLVAAGALAACGGGGTSGPGTTPTPPAALTIDTTTLGDATQGTPYSTTIAASGGVTPYTFSVVSGALPSGVLLDTGGGLGGVPSVAGSFPFTVEVADSQTSPATATQPLTLLVNPTSSGGSYAWTLITATGTAPAGRSSFAATAAPVSGTASMIVSLGSTGTSGATPVLGDSFALDTTSGSEAWSALPSGPSGRWGPSMVYDGGATRALLFGGNIDGFVNGNDVWALDLSGTPAWSQLSPTGTTIPARLEQASVFDAPHNRMIVFGGGTGFDPVTAPLGDVWELDFSGGAQGAWSQLTPTGTPPAARAAMVAIFDSSRDRMIIFSGGAAQPTGPTNDVWELDLSTPGSEAWTQIVPTGTPPPVRQYSAGAYDTVNDTLVVFGGENGVSDLGDVWELDLTPGSEAWTQVTPTGTPPAARDSHSGVYDVANHRILFYSGFTRFPSTPFTDIWALDLP